MSLILLHFNLMCSLSDYVVLTEFTVAALEDSGWYKANYTALNEIDQPLLQWGKGMLNDKYI